LTQRIEGWRRELLARSHIVPIGKGSFDCDRLALTALRMKGWIERPGIVRAKG
jgi:hypothetical protein